MIFQHWLCKFTHLFFSNPTITISDTFQTSDLQTLTFFNYFYKSRSLRERIMSSCIQPCETTTKHLNFQFTIL